MAYLAFDPIHGSAAPAGTIAAASAAAADAPATRLSALEWSVVALARRDPLSSLRTPGRVAAAMAGVFRRSTNRKLADERLEALRRLAVLTWHHSFTVPASEVKAFLAAGFTPAQYETMTASIAAARLAERRR